MAKYIDKENLPQYKYFNNFVNRYEELMDMISDLFTWQTVMHGKSDKKSRMDAFVMYEKARKSIPAMLYKNEDDQQKCAEDLRDKKRVNSYIEIMCILSFMQGFPSKEKEYVSEEVMQANPKKYLFDKRNGKHYSEIIQVPKLLLINSELFESYKDYVEMDEEVISELMSKIDKAVNYIINVQHDEVREYCYFVSKKTEKGLEVRRIDRFTHASYVSNVKKDMLPDIKTVLYCLLDYLHEAEKLEKRKKKYESKEGNSGIKSNLVSKYISKNSIKIFDMKKGDEKLEAYRYTKRNVSGWLKGYAKSPHTRRGHIRKLRSGKEVYVKGSIIHKEKFDSIESAHRINQ